MKLAVCVSGVPRSGVGEKQELNRDFKRNVRNLKKNFPGANFFFGTWRPYGNVLDKELPGQDYWLFDEPKAHYHPYLDMKPVDMVSDKMREYAGIYRKKPRLHERTRHQTKQILCHAMMVDKLPEKYDVIIRSRFDTFTLHDVDFNKYVINTYKNKTAIGFACLKPHWPTFQVNREQLDADPDGKLSHYRYLFDALIMHHGDCINTKSIYKLHQDKKLCPAEFGWYQVLSKPYNDNHRCISGWANADRCVLKQFLKG